MITYIKGRLCEKTPTSVVIEANGIGYIINISLSTFSQIPDNENIKLYTHLQIKEDSHTLFGFYSLKEREIFRLLISVSGVGSSTARTMLSSLSSDQIIDAISSNNISLVQSVKGIGSKTAQRLIIELKDKVIKLYDIDEDMLSSHNTKRDEALSALEVLGINKKSSERIVDLVIKENPDISVEEIIKETFKKYLMSSKLKNRLFLTLLFLTLLVTNSYSQNNEYDVGEISIDDSLVLMEYYEYDEASDLYYFNTKIGDINVNLPLVLTPAEFTNLILRKNISEYYKSKVDAAEGKKEGSEDTQKNLIPEVYVNSQIFESIFGGNTIQVVPQGSLEVDLGVLYTQQDNPSFSPRNRSNFTFDFDQRIGLSLVGKVGTRVQVNANFDTQSTFDFQNLLKLEFEPSEDDIIQKIEVGNVSMPLNSSLISGAQSLFGVKTELKFGDTRINAIFSEQKSESRSVVSEGGGTIQEFEFRAHDYDENRHFFLSHYFRNNYDEALLNYPYINSNIQITRVEVWVTNRNNQIEDVRNILALQDLGETDNVSSNVNILSPPNSYPDNSNNAYDPRSIGSSNSQINELVRDIATVQSGILVPNVNEGIDYGKLENAQKLRENIDYKVHPQLGYISLTQKLENDEILAVAFQYTVGDQVFQVGEFANDGIQATTVNFAQENQFVNSNNLILKLIKSTVTNVDEPIWDLMMKNIYNTGAFQLEKQDFKLNIFYKESSELNFITPVEGTNFPDPIAGSSPIDEQPLLTFFNFDRLNFNNDPQISGDGFFDFVSNITVIESTGQIIFTKVEPFGEYLFEALRLNFNEDYDGDQNIIDDYNLNQKKYVYHTLYSSTKTAAEQKSEKNKFLLKGRYKSSSGGEFPLEHIMCQEAL